MQTRTTFNGVRNNAKKYPYSVLRGSDLTHIPKVQWPVFIMKKKIPHALQSLPAGSVPTKTGTTLLLNEGYSQPMASNLVPTQGCQNVMDRGLSVPACGLRDSGELRLPPKGAVLSLTLLLVRCLR